MEQETKKISELWKKGKTSGEIAQELGYFNGTEVSRLIAKYRKIYGKEEFPYKGQITELIEPAPVIINKKVVEKDEPKPVLEYVEPKPVLEYVEPKKAVEYVEPKPIVESKAPPVIKKAPPVIKKAPPKPPVIKKLPVIKQAQPKPIVKLASKSIADNYLKNYGQNVRIANNLWNEGKTAEQISAAIKDWKNTQLTNQRILKIRRETNGHLFKLR